MQLRHNCFKTYRHICICSDESFCYGTDQLQNTNENIFCKGETSLYNTRYRLDTKNKTPNKNSNLYISDTAILKYFCKHRAGLSEIAGFIVHITTLGHRQFGQLAMK